MKKYIKILIVELEAIGLIILFFGPAITTLILCLEISPWYAFLLLSYILTTPFFVMLWTDSKIAEFLNQPVF